MVTVHRKVLPDLRTEATRWRGRWLHAECPVTGELEALHTVGGVDDGAGAGAAGLRAKSCSRLWA